MYNKTFINNLLPTKASTNNLYCDMARKDETSVEDFIFDVKSNIKISKVIHLSISNKLEIS